MATATKNKTNEELTSRQTEGTDLVLLGESGKTKIASDVVAKIAGLAIREVEGVHALVPFGAGQTLSSVAQSLGVSERKDMGVHVEVGSVEAAVDMRVVVCDVHTLPDGSQRALIRKEGEPKPLGWLTAVKDGAKSLWPAAKR